MLIPNAPRPRGHAPAESALSRAARRLTGIAGGLWRHRGGAAAIEFAMVLPLLIGMYFVSVELGQAIDTSRKLNRSAATISLIATQQSSSVSASELESMMKLGGAALQPYNRGPATFTITGVKVDGDGKTARVVWSHSFTTDPKDTTGKGGTGGAGNTKGIPIQIPDTMRTAGTFLVVVQAHLDYLPIIAWAEADRKTLGLANILWPIAMDEKGYQVTRDLNVDIACTDC